MKRKVALIPLSQDHHQGLILAQLMSKNAPEYSTLPNDFEGKVSHALKAWKEELVPHFDNEEDILFPAVKGYNEKLDRLINIILEEHVVLHQTFQSLENEPYIETMHHAGKLLNDHIRKEERELFQLIQDFVPDETLEKLIGQMEPVKKDCSL